jgi:hypothetical protein
MICCMAVFPVWHRHKFMVCSHIAGYMQHVEAVLAEGNLAACRSCHN